MSIKLLHSYLRSIWLVSKIIFNQYSSAIGVWTTNLWHVRPVPYPLSYSDMLILMCCTAKRHSFKIKAESVDFFIAIYVYQIQSLIKFKCVYQSFAFLIEIYRFVWKIHFNQDSSASWVWTTNLQHVGPEPYQSSYLDMLINCAVCKELFQNKSRKCYFFSNLFSKFNLWSS